MPIQQFTLIIFIGLLILGGLYLLTHTLQMKSKGKNFYGKKITNKPVAGLLGPSEDAPLYVA